MKVVTSILFTERVDMRDEDVDPEYFSSHVLTLTRGLPVHHTFEGKTITYRISRVERKLQFDPALGGSLRDRVIVHLVRVK